MLWTVEWTKVGRCSIIWKETDREEVRNNWQILYTQACVVFVFNRGIK